jgi:galacturan 1,4-alpha-galacturonidase
MRFLSTYLLADFIAFSLASPAWLSPWSYKDGKIDSHGLEHTSPRPTLSCHPKTPHQPLPSHQTRSKICYVSSHDDGTDDSSYILSAVNSCNNGGHVVFKKDTQYSIGTALDLRFLRHIDLGMF